MADSDSKTQRSKKETSAQDREARLAARKPYMQNRELSWLEFNKRVLDQGADPTVPLLERLQFVSIFSSNLQEFFMVRVGSITDLSLLKAELIDTKSQMTPREQLDAMYARVRELYPLQEKIHHNLEAELAEAGVKRLGYGDLNAEQTAFVDDWAAMNIMPFLTPQIINARHPFPHLESGAIYIIVRLVETPTKKKKDMTAEERRQEKEERKRLKNLGAEGVMLGIVPLPKQAQRVIQLPGEGFCYILVEDVLEAIVDRVFSMYNVKHANIISVTRNADLDATEGADAQDDDYREHMKKILKKRSRLAAVRLESKHKLSDTVSEFLLPRLKLEQYQTYVTDVPFNMGSYAFALPGMVDDKTREKLTSKPFIPAWPAEIRRNESIIEQVQKHDLMLSYPYESMDPFVQLLKEAAADEDVVSIRITLYRLANRSQLAEALIAAAEAGKEVTALFELRARFDESNNIRWSQSFEEAGCNVIYGFHDYKVHSKICSIVRRTEHGYQLITQLGTGNYNEKTARLYTDFSYITTNREIGRDATSFFRNMGMESASREYETICVAPLQIKQTICDKIDEQIALAQKGEPCGLFFKTNSITDREIIEKLSEASCAQVPVTLLVRGISCILPRIEGYTENVRVVSIVGRLLEHSRIYGFGSHDDMELYLSSADLMTRNMDKRVEIAWPVRDPDSRAKIIDYIDTCLADTAKLRELKPDGSFTDLGEVADEEHRSKGDFFNAQETLIARAAHDSEVAFEAELSEKSAYDKLSMRARMERKDAARHRAAISDLEEVFREALQHEMPTADDEALKPFLRAAAKAVDEVNAEIAAEGVDDVKLNFNLDDDTREGDVDERILESMETAFAEIAAKIADEQSKAQEEQATDQPGEAPEDADGGQPEAEGDARTEEPAPEQEPEPAAEPATAAQEPAAEAPAAEPGATEPEAASAAAGPAAEKASPASGAAQNAAEKPSKPKKRGFFQRLFGGGE